MRGPRTARPAGSREKGRAQPTTATTIPGPLVHRTGAQTRRPRRTPARGRASHGVAPTTAGRAGGADRRRSRTLPPATLRRAPWLGGGRSRREDRLEVAGAAGARGLPARGDRETAQAAAGRGGAPEEGLSALRCRPGRRRPDVAAAH